MPDLRAEYPSHRFHAVRMYLSSFRLGAAPERIVHMVNEPRRALVIANAADAYGDEARRREGVARELDELRTLGLHPVELDLRTYLDDPEGAARELGTAQLVWVRGGNTFVLRYLLARCGLDSVLKQALVRDQLVYGGYSAGVILLQKTLRGSEMVDDPDAVRRTYGDEPLWDGLGLLDYAVVPHYESPGHPETEACGRLAQFYRDSAITHRTLRDGQAIVIDGSTSELVG